MSLIILWTDNFSDENEGALTTSSPSWDAEGGLETIWTPAIIFRVSTISVLMILTLLGNASHTARLLGNVSLIVIIAGRAELRHKRVSVFLLNLAVGDLMVCFVTMTTEILFVAFGQWVLGAVACKLIVYGQIVTLASTTFLLTAMSIDRYQVSAAVQKGHLAKLLMCASKSPTLVPR